MRKTRFFREAIRITELVDNKHLFTLLTERYERRSVMITTNLMFSEWNRIFKNPMTTMAAIDRVVHHSVVLDLMGLESYRAKEATEQQSRARSAEPQSEAGVAAPHADG
jgi:hypothetical protein